MIGNYLPLEVWDISRRIKRGWRRKEALCRHRSNFGRDFANNPGHGRRERKSVVRTNAKFRILDASAVVQEGSYGRLPHNA